MLHSAFVQPDAAAVRANSSDCWTTRAELPHVHEHLGSARRDIRPSPAPTDVWTQIWSINPNERLHREIRRRTVAVGIFPGRAAIVRAVGAVLARETAEWAEGRRYLGFDLRGRCRINLVSTTDPEIEAERLPDLQPASKQGRRSATPPMGLDRAVLQRGVRVPRQYRSATCANPLSSRLAPESKSDTPPAPPREAALSISACPLDRAA